jgi:peptidoglycan/xylan/chitin deacetylase (PgdA/CDA1 family)
MAIVDTDKFSNRPFFQRLGFYMPFMIIVGMIVPVMIYLSVMKSLGWQLSTLDANGALTYSAQTRESVTLYASSNTDAYFKGIGGNYEVLLTPWRAYFSNRKLDFKEVKNALELSKQKAGVLILPSALSLSLEERTEIQAYRAKGGSVLSTWATGSRNGKGEWEGWQLLESMGVKVLGEIPVTEDARNLTFTGESPISHTLPAGHRIWMDKTSELLLRAKGEMVAARFMDYARINDETRRGEGAVVYSEAKGGLNRTAYFAFAESAWESHPTATFDLIDDTIRWLERQPALVRASWPEGKVAAQVIEMDTEQEFQNAVPFAAMMRALEYRATFYVLTSVGKLFPDVLTMLARDFEVGYHADIHIGFKGQPASVQEQRIQNMKAEMASVLPDISRINGFRAPTEGYDATTELLLQKAGIRHHTADPARTDGRLPIFAKQEDVAFLDALVVLPRTQRDDINLTKQNLSVEQTRSELIDDFDLVVDTGALGMLSVHSQNFGPDSTLVKAMPGFLEHLKTRRAQIWLASAGQVADWWRDRERFKLSYGNSGKRIEFNVTITGKTPVNGPTVMVMLPQKGFLPEVSSLKIGIPKPVISKIDDYRASIIFGVLPPGNYAYQMTFAK